ncbi:carboxypeptidase regulatory-like domain-containing protein [Luedemannella helvata]|uniref:alpha-amylase n=1 Tax=Luedemannella helvata TaxID=349315 RepID=A0ABP4WJS4_9ACTN
MPAPLLARFAVAASLAVVLGAAAPAPPAYANDTTGTVAGHLRDGTDPMPDVAVSLSTIDDVAVVSTVTDADGAFAFADVAPGDYVVRFDGPEPLRQYYHHARDAAGAQAITVTAGEQTIVEETVFPYGTLTGRVVTDGGDPLGDAIVTIFNSEDAGVANVVTDGNGVYTVPYLWPGGYRVSVYDQEYGLTQYVPQATTMTGAEVISVAAGAPTVANQTRLRTGTITGTVLYKGVPARGSVTAYAGNDSQGTATLSTKGTFSLVTLAGTVQLRYKIGGPGTPTYQWYHQKTTQDEAEPLEVSPGGTLTVDETIVDPLNEGLINGRLTYESGDVAADIPVTITSSSGATYHTTTDAYGKYSLVVPTGLHRVRFDAPQFTQWAFGRYSEESADFVQVRVNRTTTVSDVLKPGEPPAPTGIVGKLTDGGEPVAGVPVAAYTESYGWVESTTTGVDGSFAFPTAWPGNYKVRFTLPGNVQQWAHQKWSFDTADVIVVNDGGATVVNEELAPHGQVTGHLTDADGAAMGNASVTASSVDGQIQAQVTAGANGAYTVPFLPAGDYTIAFRPFGDGGPTQFAYRKTRISDAAVIPVAAGASVTVDDEILPLATVTGRLTDNGQPVRDAQVALHDAVTGEITYAFTDDNGDWQARTFPGGYKVHFALSNGLSQWAHQAREEDDAAVLTFVAGDNVVTEEMLATSTIRGRLVDHHGNVVTSGNVEISGGNEVYNAYLDENGEWSATVAPGTYKVRFVTDEGTQWAYGKPTAATADPITVPARETVVVDDDLIAPGWLRITAKDSATGAAITTFCAYADSGVIVSGCTTNGVVTFAGLSPGEYTVAAYVEDEASDYLTTEIQDVIVITDQETPLAMGLRKGATFSTTVKDAKTGVPVPGACVELVEADRPSYLGVSRRVCADSQGVVTQRKVIPDAYNLFVWVSDGVHGRQWVGPNGGVGAQAKAKTVTLIGGTTITMPAIKLDKSGSVSGVVTDKASGARLENAMVALSSYHDGHGGGGSLTATDAQGRYTLTDLGPYEWTLFFRHRDYAAQWSGDVPNRLAAHGVKVKAGKTKKYDVKLRKGTSLTGTVLGSGGRVPDSARITVINAATGDEMGSADTDANGVYQVPVLGPQVIKIRIEGSVGGSWGTEYYNDSDYLSDSHTVTVPATGTKILNITFTP